jgi:hypothetical protein
MSAGTASAALSSPEGTETSPTARPQEAKKKKPKGTCAGGIVVVEQLCDAGSAVVGAVRDAPGAIAALPGQAAAAATSGVFDQATRWMTDGARWLTKQVQSLIEETTTPELTAGWYRDRFASMAALGMGLSALVAMIALASAALRRDPDALGATFIGMFRAGLGTGLVLALVVLALGVADGISNAAAHDAAGDASSQFWGDVGDAWGKGGGFGSSAIAFFFALVDVIAAGATWIEMLARNAAVYVAVLFMPAALAASIWPRLQAWQSRLTSLLFVVIAMKPVIVVVLSLAGSAAAAGGAAPGKDYGVLLAAVMILALAACTPWVLMMVVSIDHEGSWAAGAASGAMRASTARGAGRVGGGLGRAGGAIGARMAGGRGGGASGGGARGSRGGGSAGGGAPGSGGGPGGGSPGGGGGRGGPAPASGGAGRPTGAVAAAAGLVPPPSNSARSANRGGPASKPPQRGGAGTPAPGGSRPVAPPASGPAARAPRPGGAGEGGR